MVVANLISIKFLSHFSFSSEFIGFTKRNHHYMGLLCIRSAKQLGTSAIFKIGDTDGRVKVEDKNAATF